MYGFVVEEETLLEEIRRVLEKNNMLTPTGKINNEN